MEIPGRVQNGVVVLEGGAVLPEGTSVTVFAPRSQNRRKAEKQKRVVLPLVRSKHPGNLKLTNDRIAEILQEEDGAAYSQFFPKGKKP